MENFIKDHQGTKVDALATQFFIKTMMNFLCHLRFSKNGNLNFSFSETALPHSSRSHSFRRAEESFTFCCDIMFKSQFGWNPSFGWLNTPFLFLSHSINPQETVFYLSIWPCHLVLLSIFMGTLRVLVVGENSILFICSKSKCELLWVG